MLLIPCESNTTTVSNHVFYHEDEVRAEKVSSLERFQQLQRQSREREALLENSAKERIDALKRDLEDLKAQFALRLQSFVRVTDGLKASHLTAQEDLKRAHQTEIADLVQQVALSGAALVSRSACRAIESTTRCLKNGSRLKTRSDRSWLRCNLKVCKTRAQCPLQTINMPELYWIWSDGCMTSMSRNCRP